MGINSLKCYNLREVIKYQQKDSFGGHVKQNNKMRTKDITYIALGIAALICGGIAIYQVSSFVAIPGVKYILLAPYLSMIMFVLISKIRVKHSVFVIGLPFGLIMLLMNFFMMLAIIMTSILTELSLLVVRKPNSRAFAGAVFFSGYTGASSLLISKFAIGGIFEQIPFNWIFFTTLMCLGFGIIGALLGQKILRYINRYHKSL